MKVRVLALLTVVTAMTTLGWTAAAAVSGNGSLVYQSGWTHGLAGWTALGSPGWQAGNGVATFGGKGEGEILAPSTSGLQDFAVEARIARIGSVGDNIIYGDRGYGLIARSVGRARSGIRGGFYYGNGLLDPQSGLYWAGARFPGQDVALHDGYNMFRLTVHGNQYSVSEDGVTTVRSTVDGYGSGTRIGIFSAEFRIKVKSFRLFSLPPLRSGPAREPSVLARLKSLNIQRRDVPPGFRRYFGDFYPNADIARQRGETTADLVKIGRILSYGVGYVHPSKKNGAQIIETNVAAFRTANDAKAVFASNVQQDQALARNEGFHQSIPGKFGLDDYLAVYPDRFRGKPYTFYDLLFHRGDYSVDVTVFFPTGTASQFVVNSTVTTAARAIDGRIRRLG